MTIIELTALSNGAHRNQSGSMTTAPDGWAVIPADMDIPTAFPFVDITVEDDTVTSMIANHEAYDAAMAAVSAQPEEPTQLDRIEAQTAYTALMTDTLLEV